MSATLFREGDDLEALLAELDEEHAGRVHVVSVERARVGGVLGFFARVRVAVHYELTDTPADAHPAPSPVAAAEALAADGPLDELIRAAEASEAAASPVTAPTHAPAGPARPAGPQPESANAVFAQMLLELAASKAASRATETPAAAPATEAIGSAGFTPFSPAAAASPDLTPPAGPTASRTAGPAPNRTAVMPFLPAAAAGGPSASARAPLASQPAPVPPAPVPPAPVEHRPALALRRQLAELDVPIDWVPPDSDDAYRVVEQLVARLPMAPPPPSGPGELFAVAGPAAAALRVADYLRGRMRLPADRIWAAGCPAGAVPAERAVTDVWHAAAVAAELRLTARRPSIVVVATDDPEGEPGQERWAREVLRALAPEVTWALVDASRKSSDTRASLRALGRTDALVVSGAEQTASPASVWHLAQPVALLDGRPATRAAWAVLLLDKLAELRD